MFRAAVFALLTAFLLLSQPAKADVARCLDPDYLPSFDPRLAPQTCEEITSATIRWRGGHAELRAIRPSSMPITDSPAFAARINETATAVGAAMDRMGGGMTLDNVTVLFTNYVAPRTHGSDNNAFHKGSYIAAAGLPLGPECPVGYYKLPHATSGDTFVFTLAHEVFHCIQYSSWSTMPDEAWLTEGSAEYFAYLAKSGHGAEFILDFDANARTIPLHAMEYPAVAFFLWLSHSEGPPRVREFIASTRTIQDSISPDMWIQFAQDYFDQAIRMPDGRAMLGSPRFSTPRTIRGGEHISTTNLIPYTLHNAVFVFERGKYFTLTFAPNPPDVRMKWRDEDGGAWGPPVTSVSTCDGEKRYKAIWGSTQSRNLGDIDIAAQTGANSPCTCPAGTWRETAESARRYFEQSATGGPGSTRYITGYRTLELNPDKSGSLTYNSVETETGDTSSDFWINQVKTGGSRFTWKIANGELQTVLSPGPNTITLSNEEHTRSGTRFVQRQAGAQSIYHRYYCDGAGLHLRQMGTVVMPGVPATGFTTDMDFARVGSAPPPAP